MLHKMIKADKPDSEEPLDVRPATLSTAPCTTMTLLCALRLSCQVGDT